jgi:hypothetical protein
MYNKQTNAHNFDSLLVYSLFQRSYMFRRQYVIFRELCYVALQGRHNSNFTTQAT